MNLNDESRGSNHTPIPSNGEVASAESSGSKTVDENFHLSFESMLPRKRKLTNVASKSHKGKPAKSNKKVLDDHLSWDDLFEDSLQYPVITSGPEGRSLYCLNLNCRAPPGRLCQPDLTGWWRDV